MISGAPSQDPLLSDNGEAADYQQLRELLIQELNVAPQQLQEESNLIQAGLDSIRLMRWLHWFRKRATASPFASCMPPPRWQHGAS